MNPMTMYAAVQLVADRRRETEALARRRRLAHHEDETPMPAHRLLTFGRRGATAPDSSTRAA